MKKALPIYLKITRDIYSIEEWAKNLDKKDLVKSNVTLNLNRKKVRDYEAYDIMHNNDGIVGKSVCARRL